MLIDQAQAATRPRTPGPRPDLPYVRGITLPSRFATRRKQTLPSEELHPEPLDQQREDERRDVSYPSVRYVHYVRIPAVSWRFASQEHLAVLVL